MPRVKEGKTFRSRIPIKALLSFYDDPPPHIKGHVSSITGLIGEDLGAGLLTDYFQTLGYKVSVLPGNVTQGTTKGKRLDRWIIVKKGNKSKCFQVEIKNWGASAIGGRSIAITANASVLRSHKIERWSKEWNGRGFIKDSVKKVLTPMKSPIKGTLVEPLACFWDAMHPTGGNSPLFSIPLRSSHFSRVWVFSMSAHLRNLLKSGKRLFYFDAPAIKMRLEFLRMLIDN